MQAYRLETTVTQDNTLILPTLPLQAGEAVEVIILVKPASTITDNPYPLRNTAVTYLQPTEPVAQSEWEAAR